jgi:hypothetical protein
MNNKLILALLIAAVIIIVIMVILCMTYYRKYMILKKRYIFLSNEFDTLSTAYYMKGQTAADEPANGKPAENQ